MRSFCHLASVFSSAANLQLAETLNNLTICVLHSWECTDTTAILLVALDIVVADSLLIHVGNLLTGPTTAVGAVNSPLCTSRRTNLGCLTEKNINDRKS